ncbi:MAG: efflux RND transporter periplasmic adaptor subunit [Hyphomicrobiales bacterium]|nr:efflux RND transporter periplasmic adaptor subunit [Hyphomicrobiales bacterium]
MSAQTDDLENQDAPAAQPTAPPPLSAPEPERSRSERRSARRAPAILATLIVVAIVGLSLWYLAQPQPLLVQGEADATRIDIAARVDGRVGKRPVERGDNVTAAEVLYEIDNPELLTKLRAAEAGLAVASANLANIEVGTRAEDIAQRKAAQESAAAQLTLAQQTYARIKQLADSGNAPLQQLDQATNSLKTAQSAVEQAKFAYDEAVAGPTKEQRDIARANVAEAQAKVNSIRAQVDELVVKAPIAAQVYQIGAELGEYVSPGAPLLTLVDLSDVWLRFDLREDLVKRIAVGKKVTMRAPALGDEPIVAEVRFIAPKGEYAGWRATRATGDFDLRTFEVRAYPTPPIPGLRPGMSAYVTVPASGQ